jgi:adenosylhomocysteine nucleosidase
LLYPATNPKTFIYSALPCEAKPLIDCYKLKKDTSIQAFSIFRNDDIVLTVTGIGKSAMAAGLAYSQALYPQNPHPVLVNIGIAGHRSHALGSLFLADKITDDDTGRRYYPPLIFSPPCPTANLITFAKPQHAYPESALCDMEASAFYETATRFSSGELVHCLKIVSDNESLPAQEIQPKQVSALISEQLPSILTILNELSKLAGLLKPQELNGFDQLLSQYRFSANEQIQLKKLLSRWHLLKGQQKAEPAIGSARNGKEFLKLLDSSLNEAEFYL